MDKHKKIFKSYKRNHNDEFIIDSETSKASKEKIQSLKLDRTTDKLISKLISNNEDDNLIDEIKTVSYESKKVSNNSNTHKHRLKELQKNDDCK